MHPGFFAYWKARRAHGCEAHAGEGFGAWASGEGDFERGDFGGGAFGVRRPLRFLAYKLQLDEKQVAELAAILNDLKTERAQAAVDDRRTTATFADAVAADAFDPAKAQDAADTRVRSAARLRDAVVKALGRIHAVLSPEQRAQLAYLIRTGTLTI